MRIVFSEFILDFDTIKVRHPQVINTTMLAIYFLKLKEEGLFLGLNLLKYYAVVLLFPLTLSFFVII